MDLFGYLYNSRVLVKISKALPFTDAEQKVYSPVILYWEILDLFYDKHYLETLDSDIFVQKEKAIRNSENTNVESWEDSLLNIRFFNIH